MSYKESAAYSIIHNKCPRCHEGHFFHTNNPYNITEFSKMDKSCSVCGANYEPEYGFYFGSMFVSYGLNVLVFVALFIAVTILLPSEASLLLTLSLIIIPMLLLTPVTFRLSRLLWINFFVKYEKGATKKLQENVLMS